MQDFYPRPRSPFDASALERLRRMGLAGADGQADQDAMAVFAHIFAGQFFDDLCDYYQNSGAVRDLLVQMLDSAETAEPKHYTDDFILKLLYEVINKRTSLRVKLPEGVFDMTTPVHGIFE